MRLRFSAGDAGSSSDELTMADSGEWHVDEGFGTSGKGHVLSLLLSGQNSLIFSKRYHCLSAVRPFGGTIGGIVEVTLKEWHCCRQITAGNSCDQVSSS